MNQTNNWTTDKHLLITGASSGIGKELAISLTGIAKKLTLISRNKDGELSNLVKTLKEKTEELSRKTEIEFFSADICDRQKANEIISKIYNQDNSQIDAFINSAGGSHLYAPFETMSNHDINSIFDTNAKAPIFWLRELLPRMKNNSTKKDELKRGHIIFLSSRSAERSLSNLSIYTAAKGSIEHLCSALRVEYASYGIGFTLINPGSINTNFTKYWTREQREAHNAESMSVSGAILPIILALNLPFLINNISYESVEQWFSEPSVVKPWKH